MKKALTIAGSDSGGGAGIQADLKTFQEMNVFGMSVITAVTAQNSLGVQGVYPIPAGAVESQLTSIFSDMVPDAVKTGMLFDADRIELAAEYAKAPGAPPFIVDPVMISTSGHHLLEQDAEKAIMEYLLPHAALITPNLPEAETLTGMDLNSLESRVKACSELRSAGAEAVLLKGGHDSSTNIMTDIYQDSSQTLFIRSPRVETEHTHGTGCTYAAAVTAGVASGKPMKDAVCDARRFLHAALLKAEAVGQGPGPVKHSAWRTAEDVELEVEPWTHGM
ncbi:bifunctional hydroxymethylpyrimidine kinase/phosphomethylpyrimidine kinase [Bacillus urumqiensis]|uniref:Hydroxymethylpyrimidine/phosphomethylpyrimidine kinase n=1 Tax=Alkalicoccus urumqiensis TaxID=1548213 RepID=A0A2P6MIN5_ALKUR|nr:bifunctional hydroxymethylpyrimidine kinase/phosphomethylpyrimidine kinase [Alkalicoccus urumqiensis]